jgi:hypothetical protein
MDPRSQSQSNTAEGAITGAGILDPEMEELMAADEAAWAKDAAKESGKTASGRDAAGRFTGEPEAPDAPAESDEVEGEAEIAKGQGTTDAAENDADLSTGKPDTKKQQTDTNNEGKAAPVKADEKAKAGDDTKTKAAANSAWAKEGQRKANTWAEINKTKTELATEREQFRLEREQFEAQQKNATETARDSQGYTATDYDRAARQFATATASFTQKAIEAEARGDFAAADEFNAKAAQNSDLARKAGERVAALRGGPSSTWKRLQEDLPEALEFNGPVNTELRALLRGNPKLLGDPVGPYRAAVLVGRKLLRAAEAERDTLKAEAVKVPGLSKQVAELSARLKELTEATSLTGSDAIMSRGGNARNFADLSLEEMEAQLAGSAD